VQSCVHARMTSVRGSLGALLFSMRQFIMHCFKREFGQLCRFQTSVLGYICEYKRSVFCEACLLATILLASIRSSFVCILIAYHACKLPFVQLLV
jgi:hypothetical protein